MKRLYLSLSRPNDIDRIIKELKEYQESLKDKAEIFVERLAELGIPIIEERINSVMGDSDPEHQTYITIHSFDDYKEAILTVEGKDLLFIEFGAGIHYNASLGGSPHPWGEDLGYRIGTYGKGQGAKDYWYYTNEKGDSVRSHGTKAAMPVYYASLEIYSRIEEIAREVFSNG